MKNYRMAAVLAVLAMLLALVPASMAQEMTFGLSQEDFNVLTAANAASAAATSAQFTFTANLSANAEGESGSIDLTGSGAYDIVAGVFQLTLGGQADMGDGETMPVNAELRVTGGAAYIQLPAMLGPQWLMISPEELEEFGSGFTEGLTESLPFSPDALASGDATGMEGMAEAMMALATLQPEDYILMTRSGDTFTTVLDITGLIGSNEIQAAIRQSIAANADELEDSGMSEAEVNQILANLPTALQGTSATLSQTVSGGLISRTVLSLALNVDPAVIGEMGDPANIALNFDISLSGYNQPVTVAAPADAMPLSQMFGGMSG